jgi:hypothetical protein
MYAALILFVAVVSSTNCVTLQPNSPEVKATACHKKLAQVERNKKRWVFSSAVISEGCCK